MKIINDDSQIHDLDGFSRLPLGMCVKEPMYRGESFLVPDIIQELKEIQRKKLNTKYGNA